MREGCEKWPRKPLATLPRESTYYYIVIVCGVTNRWVEDRLRKQQ